MVVVPSPQTVGTSQSREEVEKRREEEGEEGQRLKSNERKEVGERQKKKDKFLYTATW